MREPYAHRRAHVHRHALTAGESALEIRDFDAVDTGNLGFLLHMRKKKQNIPSDYEIPVQYIPKEVAGRCWVVLNIYPLEQSLRRLSDMFGAISSNKDNIVVFIAMLKSLRFTFDHEELETAMQLFQCHYQESSFLSGVYFDYINDVLNTASEETSSFSCKPPPCPNSHTSPGQDQEAVCSLQL